jgi:limonene-1,2-epoxide hydrolase
MTDWTEKTETTDPIAVARALWAALDSRDWDRLARFLTDETIYYDVPTGPGTAARGPTGIIARLRLGLDELSGYENVEGTIAAQGDVVMIEHAETWTWPSGEVAHLPFVTVHRVVGGRVVLWKDYWDYETLRRAAPPGWEERLLTADVSWLFDATGIV